MLSRNNPSVLRIRERKTPGDVVERSMIPIPEVWKSFPALLWIGLCWLLGHGSRAANRCERVARSDWLENASELLNQAEPEAHACCQARLCAWGRPQSRPAVLEAPLLPPLPLHVLLLLLLCRQRPQLAVSAPPALQPQQPWRLVLVPREGSSECSGAMRRHDSLPQKRLG